MSDVENSSEGFILYPWFQIDTNIGTKPEVVRIKRATREEKATIVGRLALFWCIVDEYGDLMPDEERPEDRPDLDGFVPDYALDDLVEQCGGDRSFWQAVIETGWLAESPEGLWIPGFAERFHENAKRRHAATKRKNRERLRKADVIPTQTPAAADVKKPATTTRQPSRDRVTNVTATCDKSVTRGEERRGQDRKEQPPPPPSARAECSTDSAAAAVSWKEAEDRLRSTGLGKVDATLEQARQKLTAGELVEIVDQFEAAPKGTFASPGAIAYRVENGCWPRELPTAKNRGDPDLERLEAAVGEFLDGLTLKGVRRLCEIADEPFEMEDSRTHLPFRIRLLRFLEGSDLDRLTDLERKKPKHEPQRSTRPDHRSGERDHSRRRIVER